MDFFDHGGDGLPAADLFIELADLGPDDRTVRLAAITDDALRREVEDLFAADAEADTLLRRLDRLAPPPAEPSSRTDERIGAYRIVGEIGRGGMGVVYRAEDPRLGREVALKFLPRALSADPEARARLMAEARAASALDHPNVCTVHAVEETDDGQLYLVLACYEGETLKARLRQGPLPAGEALGVAKGIAAGLAAAHARGIVHRDVKPSNVLLTPEGIVKVLDFGIARSAESDATRTGAALGTAAYMAPEQTRGERVDERADVWALGVVIYEMLAGRRPFTAEGEALVHAIRHDAPPPLPDVVPPALARVVDRALAKRAEDRYTDASALLSDLEAGRVTPGRRWQPMVAVGLGLVLAAAAWLGLSRHGGEPAPGDTFVIAVAPFAAAGAGADAEAEVMQALVRRALDDVLDDDEGVRVIELGGEAPQLQDQAEALGEVAGAHLVVWGEVVALGHEVEILPSLVQAVPYPGAASEASDLAGAAVFRVDLTEPGQLALRRTAAAEVGDLALLIAARAYAERVQPDRTLALLGRLRHPSAGSERIAGMAYVLKHETEAAEQHLRAALGLDSTDVTAWMWLGALLMDDGRLADAEAEARRALAVLPESWGLYVILSWSLTQQGRLEEAVEAARRAVQVAPEAPLARVGLGWAYFMTGRLEEAVHAFEAATAAEGRVEAVDGYEGLAEVRFAQGRFDASEAAARAALRLRPRYVLGCDLLGRALLAQGRLEDAERAWSAAARATSSPATVVYYPLLVAYVRARLGRPDAAAPLYALADTLSGEPFLAPMLHFAVGRATEAEVLAEAAETSPSLGRDWLREAHWMLGYLYEAGVGAVEADTARALLHYREAVARDYFPEGALSQLTFALRDLEGRAGVAR